MATEVVLQAACVVVSAPAETTLEDTPGVNAVMLVAVFAVMVAAAPPIVTPVAADKFVPVMVTAVPPAIGPDVGLSPVTVGAAAYVYPPVRVALPPAVVTSTVAVPADPAGVTAVRLLPSAATTTFVAALPPRVTPVAPVRLLPVIITFWPPASGPLAGMRLLMLGPTTGATEFEADEAGPVPALFVAVTVNVYAVPFVNCVTAIGLDGPVPVKPPGDEVTV